jgi:hypothetical protein
MQALQRTPARAASGAAAMIALALGGLLNGCGDRLDPLAHIDGGKPPTALTFSNTFTLSHDVDVQETFSPHTIAVLSSGEKTQVSVVASVSVYQSGFHPISYAQSEGVSQSVFWSSSDQTVATVDENGKITARHSGTTTITATSVKNSDAKASALVTVLPEALRFSALDVGNAACGITLAHAVYCWGVQVNVYSPAEEPYDVGPTLKAIPEPAASISVGGVYYPPNIHLVSGCALGQSGAAYCWGDNSVGQIGDGTELYRMTPVAVSGGLHFKAIAVGQAAVCALDLDGAAYCWGNRLKDATPAGPHLISASLVPIAVPGGLHFKSIAVGVEACGIVDDGTAYCWGDTPVPVAGNQKFAQLAVAPTYTCGRSTDNDVYCWGTSTSGGLGLGPTATTAAVPTLVPGGIKFSSISVGKTLDGTLTCGLAVEGKAYCWGSNGNGQLGAGLAIGENGAIKFSPTLVTAPGSWTALSAGALHACGMTNGKAYCWGWMFGQRADQSNLPALMEGQGP